MLDEIKDHVSRHKVAYLVGSYILIAGITYAIMRGRIEALALRGAYGLETMDTLVTNRPLSFLSPASNQNISTITIRQELGRPPYLIHDIGSDLWYKSQRSAAKAIGVSESHMSNHLNGLLSHVDGHELERVAFSV